MDHLGRRTGAENEETCASLNKQRDVAQLGSALRSGRRGRWFESSHPDLGIWVVVVHSFGERVQCVGSPKLLRPKD